MNLAVSNRRDYRRIFNRSGKIEDRLLILLDMDKDVNEAQKEELFKVGAKLDYYKTSALTSLSFQGFAYRA